MVEVRFEMPVVSIILPTFNRAKTIERSIRSALTQTYTHFELIVVDDCSTDSTGEVLAMIIDPRLHIMRHTKNCGAVCRKKYRYYESQGELYYVP